MLTLIKSARYFRSGKPSLIQPGCKENIRIYPRLLVPIKTLTNANIELIPNTYTNIGVSKQKQQQHDVFLGTFMHSKQGVNLRSMVFVNKCMKTAQPLTTN